jgi:elongation factor P
MHPTSFDQIQLDASLLENDKDLAYVQDGMIITVDTMQSEGNTVPLLVHLPSTHTFTVLADEPGLGQASKGVAYKTAFIGTMTRIQVPDFIKIGDSIVVDLERHTYKGRA